MNVVTKSNVSMLIARYNVKNAVLTVKTTNKTISAIVLHLRDEIKA